jgi:hypothetical protein
MTHLEGDVFELPNPLAKPIYGLMEDSTGRVHFNIVRVKGFARNRTIL